MSLLSLRENSCFKWFSASITMMAHNSRRKRYIFLSLGTVGFTPVMINKSFGPPKAILSACCNISTMFSYLTLFVCMENNHDDNTVLRGHFAWNNLIGETLFIPLLFVCKSLLTQTTVKTSFTSSRDSCCQRKMVILFHAFLDTVCWRATTNNCFNGWLIWWLFYFILSCFWTLVVLQRKRQIPVCSGGSNEWRVLTLLLNGFLCTFFVYYFISVIVLLLFLTSIVLYCISRCSHYWVQTVMPSI